LLSWSFKINIIGRYNYFFNSTVKAQNKNFKSIPIIIISFNQLKYLKQLVAFLKEKEYSNIVIIDNLSTYKPLLDYYKTIDKSVTIIMNDKNDGHRVFWKNKRFFSTYGKGYYVITDSDIVPDKDCPEDFLNTFKKALEKNKTFLKVGFSLRLDDIPDSNLNKLKVLNWEKQFWKNKNSDGHFLADIDTTFALYRPMNLYDQSRFYRSLRFDKPYIAKHGGWYVDNKNLTEEQNFYMQNANSSSSWRLNNKGELGVNSYV
jgi:hypothetical protein